MKYCIVALGKLGSRLYSALASKENQVIGTYKKNAKNLENEVYFDYLSEQIPSQIIQSDVLVFNLTPSVIQSVDLFKSFISKIDTKHFIFISSTSVYGMQGHVDEEVDPIAQTSSGKLLKECEDYLLEKNFKATIIRPSGLYCNIKHPGFYLAGKEVNINGLESVNLIHYDDLVEIILKSVNLDIKVINASNIHHPKKGEYYTDFCIRNNLPAPIFKTENNKNDKIVNTKYQQFKIDRKLP